MSLGLYSEPDASAQLDSLKPFTITFDGRIGGAQDRLVYVRNNNATLWYSNITISAVDADAGLGVGEDLTDQSVAGWFWKLTTKDIPMTEEEWNLVTAGTTLSLSNIGSSVIGDIVTFLPFWVRIQIPRGQDVSVITDIVLRINATESLV